MNKDTLPTGWTGNKSRHHMKVGAFTLEVIELPGMAKVWVWNIRVEKILFLTDSGRWDSAEGARDACKLALKDHLSRVMQLLG